MITAANDRASHLNALLGKPYRLGAAGSDAFDCYGLARHLQSTFYGRESPLFEMPAKAGRIAIAAAIAAHPERQRWVSTARAIDGAAVSMAKQDIGYHLGTYIEIDGGLVVHALEDCGVVAEPLFTLRAFGWRRIQFLVPIDAAHRS